jgi:hypothetical protein
LSFNHAWSLKSILIQYAKHATPKTMSTNKEHNDKVSGKEISLGGATTHRSEARGSKMAASSLTSPCPELITRPRDIPREMSELG